MSDQQDHQNLPSVRWKLADTKSFNYRASVVFDIEFSAVGDMTGENIQLMEHGPYEFRIEPHGEMQVPGIIYAAKDLLPTDSTDKTLQQVVNVATLSGIKRASFAMPDLHWGYGFPIGGVAATDIVAGGVVSPGGVGFDISCGVRLLSSTVDQSGLHALSIVMDQLGKLVPRGPGPGGYWQFSDREELRSVLSGGSSYCVDIGQGVPQDLDRCEDGGTLADADPAAVSQRAMSRGAGQLGSLGSGNHFLEVQAVTEVEDPVVAEKFGLHPNQICVMIHCGSRGLGHQVCLDYVQRMDAVMSDYDIAVPDRQLACAPVSSPEGIAYLGAMNAAANYGRANRQMLTQAARAAFADIGAELDLVYDISHNMAKIESHNIDDKHRSLCVHRKGATRALPPGHADLSDDLRDSGQPVLIPGSMGTASYVLTGMPGNDAAFHSTCHGAGRVWSRHQAMRTVGRDQLQAQLQRRGIEVRGTSWRGLVEEAPEAYKDIASVVDAAEGAGLARKVAKLEPIGVVKG